MKNLSIFSSNKISLEEQSCIKGGIRFITENKGLAKAKTKVLKAQGASFVFEKEICDVTGNKVYCIEW